MGRRNDDPGLPAACAVCPEPARVHGFCRGHYAKLDFDLQYRLRSTHEDGDLQDYHAAQDAAKEFLV
jgi:hypothetical protein